MSTPDPTPERLAPTPPMGWNSWNGFTEDVSEEAVRAAADAIVGTGMRDLGYTYVVIDDCWSVKSGRDGDGNLNPDPHRFPSGMMALADTVHAKGLKLGIYSDAADKTCAGWPGSYGNEVKDTARFAEWGIDFLKYDYCHAPEDQASAIERYTRMGDALRACGRPILFSVCEWGRREPWTWARKAGGQMWRTTGDVVDKWIRKEGDGGGLGVLDAIDRNAPLVEYARPGGWNDPDMLVIGLRGGGHVGGGGCTDEEYRTQMSLWCVMAAPLMAGCDLRTVDKTSLDIMTNPEIIAVHQDPLGVQGRRVREEAGREAWVKPLAGGDIAVCLFNRLDEPSLAGIEWRDLGLEPSRPALVQDIWAREDVGEAVGEYEATVAAHQCVALRVSPR